MCLCQSFMLPHLELQFRTTTKKGLRIPSGVRGTIPLPPTPHIPTTQYTSQMNYLSLSRAEVLGGGGRWPTHICLFLELYCTFSSPLLPFGNTFCLKRCQQACDVNHSPIQHLQWTNPPKMSMNLDFFFTLWDVDRTLTVHWPGQYTTVHQWHRRQHLGCITNSEQNSMTFLICVKVNCSLKRLWKRSIVRLYPMIQLYVPNIPFPPGGQAHSPLPCITAQNTAGVHLYHSILATI